MTLITTPLGRVEGVEHRGCLAFRGIRFAKAPVGERRFRPPEPVDSWSGIYDAREFGASAPQPPMLADGPLQLPQEPTDEDCLFLNVYTPAADGGRRPVLFWIHGGGYVGGSGRVYDGSVFAREHDVVVVTVNYRLGALGFLHVGHLDPELASSVNNGILDQVCALEWVRDNVAAFGGDPENVLIFGESAGGTSTAMLLGCPAADGLYHKAIVHSPNVDLIPVGPGHVDFTSQCVRRLGGDPERRALETLRAAEIPALLTLMLPDPAGPPPEPSLGVRLPDAPGLSPAIDGHLIPRPVADTVRDRGTANVPLIGGGCRHEGTLFDMIVGPGDFSSEDAARLLADSGADGGRALEVYERFAPGSTPREKLRYAMTDTLFRNSMVRILDAAADAGARCWSWMVTWETDVAGLRATHAMDLPFLWNWVDPDLGLEAMQRFAGKDAPHDLGRAMRAYWVAFARTGRPEVSGLPEWRPHDKVERPVLVLDRDVRMETLLDDEVRGLWLD